MAAGAIAQKALAFDNLQITTYVDRIHDISCPEINEIPTLEQIEALQLVVLILNCRKDGKSNPRG